MALEREGISPADKEITILGAGGAARAIAVECALAGASHLTIINRNPERGQELADLITQKTKTQADYCPWKGTVKIPEKTQILIQATCVGLYPEADQKPDIDYDTITPNMVVSDVVFHPVHPLFLQEAQKRGARTVTGIGMLVQQGALNFTLWTGKEAPVEVMYAALGENSEIPGNRP
jgi:shikimate dehydrogenase